MKKVLFVYNPVSGKGLVKRRMFDVVDFYNEHDCLVTLCPMFKLYDHEEVLADRELDIYDYIVVSGGDGTLNRFLEYIKDYDINQPISYLPTGSTNDYAATLGIPKQFGKALERTIRGYEQAIDIGRFNERSFLYVAAFGIFTKVVYTTNQKIKNIIGYSAYMLEGIKQFGDLQSYELVMNINGETIEGSFILGVISNALSIGGMNYLTSDGTVLDDGLFEILFIRTPSNPIELAGTVSSLRSKNPEEKHGIIIRKASEIHIEHASMTEWTLDGEFGGARDVVDISVVNKGFRIVV